MINRVLLAVLLLLQALPACAGSGTIRETDTEIFIEYSGDEDDKKVIKAVQEEKQIVELKEEKIAEYTRTTTAIHDARRKERHKDD